MNAKVRVTEHELLPSEPPGKWYDSGFGVWAYHTKGDNNRPVTIWLSRVPRNQSVKGRYVGRVDGSDHPTIDDNPRYFMDLGRAKLEMVSWFRWANQEARALYQ
jgi:hypothetical protein